MTNADPLRTTEGRNWLLNCVMEAPPEDLERTCNIQLLNLLCADRLPGNAFIDIRKCLARLDGLIDFIRGSVRRTYDAYGPSPDYAHCRFQTWMACLVTRMKQSFGVSYNPKAKAELESGVFGPTTDASAVFINGMLGDDPARRWGTCASIPVLVTAIARKLGYPVRLARAREHLYCRWEGEGRCFNIEASNPMGMTVESDEHYRQLRGGIPPQRVKSGFYFRQLTAAEEFACFMTERVGVLKDANRLDEAIFWCARALQYAPANELFAYHAYSLADQVLKNRLRIKHSEMEVREGLDFFYHAGDLMALHERPLFLTIEGHYREYEGDVDRARGTYENACRQNFHGGHEQRDLQRFLKKFDLPCRARPLLPPQNLGQPRRFKLTCPPEQEAEKLFRMADDFERRGEPLKARDALHDLYMLDPGDAEVFQRARTVEKLPLFQSQLSALVQQVRSANGSESSILGGCQRV